jgi:hypothetical protein
VANARASSVISFPPQGRIQLEAGGPGPAEVFQRFKPFIWYWRSYVLVRASVLHMSISKQCNIQ